MVALHSREHELSWEGRMQSLYSELLTKSSVFSSREEILFYRKMWSSHDFLMPGILCKVGALSDNQRIIGLYPTTQHVGFCVLSSASRFFPLLYHV